VIRTNALLGLLVMTACSQSGSARKVVEAGSFGGDAARGREAIARFDCGTCHTIPGVTGARGLVAPPLNGFAQRAFISGEIPNTRANLVRWIMHPQYLVPKTPMPDLGAPEQSARDMAAYLYSLR
jgi:cytochrome c